MTDCPEILRKQGYRVDAKPVLQACESLSINTIDELAQDMMQSDLREAERDALLNRNGFESGTRIL